MLLYNELYNSFVFANGICISISTYFIVVLLVLGTRVRKRKTPTSAGKPGAKKMKKRNPWSDDESKSESDLEETEPVVIPRDSLLRRAAGIAIHFIFILYYSLTKLVVLI